MTAENGGRVTVAMSGGVDSSVAALLLLRAGYDCIGATMRLYGNEDIGIPKEHTCCSLDDVIDARDVCRKLGIEHFVFNFSGTFKKEVIDRFVAAYESGRTPNPCIDCNRYLKFDTLYRRSRELSREYVATGHYARTKFDEKSGRWLLLRAADARKDQSYVLYSLTQDELAHTLFPLGDLKKEEVRALAEEAGLTNARKHDSQDICFVPDGKYGDFIEKYKDKHYPEGDFVDSSGRVLGRHRGIVRYTVGQRKGLGLSLPHPMYVKSVDAEKNTVTLADESELYTSSLVAHGINLISVREIKEPMRVTAKVRYSQRSAAAAVTQTDEDTISVVFDEPQRAITPGQAVVLYDGDVVVGGGTIL